MQVTRQVYKSKTGFSKLSLQVIVSEKCKEALQFELISHLNRRRQCNSREWMSFSQATQCGSLRKVTIILHCLLECLQPVTQTSRPVFPDLITILGRWSRLRNERLCGIVVKGTDSGVTLLGPKAWLSHCLAE